MNAVVALDLDRTMIYSRAAMTDEQFAAQRPVCVEWLRGAPLSYMSESACSLLSGLARRALVVPATTRTPEQFQRVALPGAPYRYVVASNGGALIVDGRVDTSWRERIDQRVAAGGHALATVVDELRRRIDDSWVGKLRIADDLFCYLVVNVSAQPADFLEQWRSWCAPRGWNVTQQGRKIYTMPDAVTKSGAVRAVRDSLIADGTLGADSPVFAAGDGVLDRELLEYADAAMRPRHGELEELGWQHPTVTVTETRGLAAAGEILTWLHHRTTHRRPDGNPICSAGANDRKGLTP